MAIRSCSTAGQQPGGCQKEVLGWTAVGWRWDSHRESVGGGSGMISGWTVENLHEMRGDRQSEYREMSGNVFA